MRVRSASVIASVSRVSMGQRWFCDERDFLGEGQEKLPFLREASLRWRRTGSSKQAAVVFAEVSSLFGALGYSGLHFSLGSRASGGPSESLMNSGFTDASRVPCKLLEAWTPRAGVFTS